MIIPSDNRLYPLNRSTLLSLLFVLAIFTKGLTFYPAGLHFGIDCYAYLAIPLFFLHARLSRREWTTLSLLAGSVLAINATAVFFADSSCLLVLKQFIPIVVFYTAAYGFLKKTGPIAIFEHYVRMAVLVSILGLLQLALYLCGFSLYMDTPGRINSVLPEPSHLAIVLIPAFCFLYSLYGLLHLRTIIVLGTIVGTFSATGYLTLFIFFLMKHFKRQQLKSYTILILLCAAAFTVYFLSYEIRYRIGDLVDYSRSGSLENVNATTFSAFSNLQAALFALKKNPLLGAGLGNHQQVYREYFEKSEQRNHRKYGLNMQGGHSLSIRLLSETGLLGAASSVFFFYRLRTPRRSGIYSAISLASLMYFIGRIFKLGGYFDYGIYFFAAVYLFAYIGAATLPQGTEETPVSPVNRGGCEESES